MILRIGVDFDNTLISYEGIFRDLAAARGWLPKSFPASKSAVKARLLKEDGNDLRWQRLQADAYGKHILRAKPFAGSASWLKGALAAGHEVYIVSHKSVASHLDPSVKLRDKAKEWLKANRLMVNGHADPSRLKAENVIFAATRDEKVAAIKRLRLDAFVDDLLPVLEHRHFPRTTLPLHFHGRTTWREISRRLEAAASVGPDAVCAIAAVLGSAPASARPLPGGNNRLIVATLDDGREVLVKRYLLDARDSRDRAGTEQRALGLMAAAGLRCVPKAFYKDPDGAFTLLAVLPGRPMKGLAMRGQVLQAARFMRRVMRLPKAALPPAAEARLRLSDYPRGLEARLSRILSGLKQPQVPAEARRFVNKELVPLKNKLVAEFREKAKTFAEIGSRERIASPSDFGFHNAVLSPKGRVQFLDFEYFGQDDPVKLAADFTFHLGQRISPELRALFVRELAKALPDREAFLRRFELVKPLIGLEWALIALNVLAPEQLARRRFSNPGVPPAALIKRRLAAARKLIRRLK